MRTKYIFGFQLTKFQILFTIGISLVFIDATYAGEASRYTNIYNVFSWRGREKILDDVPDLKQGIDKTINAYEKYGFDKFTLWNFGRGEPLPEQLPVELDTSGNWGSPVDGLQISLRLQESKYAVGEPIFSMVLLRNLEPTNRAIWIKGTPRNEFQFILWKGTNAFTWAEPPPPQTPFSSSSGLWYTMPGHSEAAIFVQLDNIFDLSTPGQYSIQVRRPTILRSGQGMTNVISGTAYFRIVDKLSSSEIAAREALAKSSKELHEKAVQAYKKVVERRRANPKAINDSSEDIRNY